MSRATTALDTPEKVQAFLDNARATSNESRYRLGAQNPEDPEGARRFYDSYPDTQVYGFTAEAAKWYGITRGDGLCVIASHDPGSRSVGVRMIKLDSSRADRLEDFYGEYTITADVLVKQESNPGPVFEFGSLGGESIQETIGRELYNRMVGRHATIQRLRDAYGEDGEDIFWSAPNFMLYEPASQGANWELAIVRHYEPSSQSAMMYIIKDLKGWNRVLAKLPVLPIPVEDLARTEPEAHGIVVSGFAEED